MIIAHVLTSLHIGGGERVTLELASAQVLLGHRVLAVSLGSGSDDPLADAFRARNVDVHRLAKTTRGLDPTLILRLAALFWRNRVGVAHLHNRLPLIYGVPAARLTGALAIHTRHGPRPAGPRQEWLVRMAAKGLHAYVAVSEDVRGRALTQEGISPDRLSVIDNGIDVERYQRNDEARAAIRAELGIPPKAWVVGAVGRFAPEKDFPLLVRAVAPLLGPDSRLLLVGDGDEMPAVRAEVERQAAGPFVVLPGSRNDVPECLAAMDAFVLSSRMEGMPISVLEAMASGLPLVASKVGALPGLIADGVNGLLFPIGDEEALRTHLQSLRAAPDRAQRIANLGRELVRAKHSREAMARRYLDLYARRGARA